MDLVDLLQPPEDAVFYLIDSLRPIEVHNVYNGVQVKIIVLNVLNSILALTCKVWILHV